MIENFKGQDDAESGLTNGLFGNLISSPVTWVVAALPFVLGFIWFFKIRKKHERLHLI